MGFPHLLLDKLDKYHLLPGWETLITVRGRYKMNRKGIHDSSPCLGTSDGAYTVPAMVPASPGPRLNPTVLLTVVPWEFGGQLPRSWHAPSPLIVLTLQSLSPVYFASLWEGCHPVLMMVATSSSNCSSGCWRRDPEDRRSAPLPTFMRRLSVFSQHVGRYQD